MDLDPHAAIGETPPARRKSGRKSRRDQITDIAVELFAQNGFDRTSIRDIADAAGLTKPALYYHFQDKEALFEHVLVERMSELIASVSTAIDEVEDPLDRIRAFLVTHAGRMDDERDAWMMSRQSYPTLQDEDRRMRVTRLRDTFERTLRDLIQDAVDAGQLDADTNPTLVGRLLLSAVNDVPRWLRPNGRMTAREVARTYVDITLRGVGAAI